MNIIYKFEDYLKKEIKRIYPDIRDDDFSLNLELSPDTEEGDFGFGCFSIAKLLKKNPQDIMENLSESISRHNVDNGDRMAPGGCQAGESQTGGDKLVPH